MGLKIDVWIDVLEKKFDSKDENNIELMITNVPNIRAKIGLPAFLTPEIMEHIKAETTWYLARGAIRAREEIEVFCEDLRSVGYWDEEHPARFTVDENGVTVYSPYMWHGNSNKVLSFHGETLKQALLKALVSHRKQDNEISELSDEKVMDLIKNHIEKIDYIDDLLDYWKKAKLKRDWIEGRKVIAKIQNKK